MRSYKSIIIALGFVAGITGSGCKNYLDIPLPVDRISNQSAFTNDKSCAATLNGIFGTLSGGSLFDGQGIGYKGGLYTDELTNYSVSELNTSIYSSVVAPGQVSDLWTTFYAQIYRVNAALEGIAASKSVLNHRAQWMGEAYFLRALLHLYLAGIYGDVPVVVTSDYAKNNVLPRSPLADVYKQVIDDLLQAEKLLPESYADVNGNTTPDRGRPNRGAATALLARVYLYTRQYQLAADKASDVISQNTLYSLAPLANTFTVAGNKETIAALAPLATNTLSPYVKDRYIYLSAITSPEIPAGNTISSYGVNGVLSQSLVKSFETGDQRFTQWTYGIYQVKNGDTSRYYIPNKYKSKTTNDEYVVLIRLAEVYLVRAEALAQLGNTGAAARDLDAIRLRAGLKETTANTKETLMTAIVQERRTEFFTEEAHRLMDLRRLGLLDEVMTKEVKVKNGTWQSFQQYWPISPTEIQANPNLKQTLGY